MSGFKNFVLRGNLVDFAVAVIIAIAFGTVVTTFTEWLTGLMPDSADKVFGTDKASFGAFLNAVIAFLILAAVVYFFVVVPYNNTFRRFVVNPVLRGFYALWKLRGKGLGFTEFRYAKAEMDRFLRNTDFEVLRVEPDDFLSPWNKGLFVDLCDVGSFVHHEHKPPFEFGRFGSRVIATIQSAGLWHSCAGIFYVARARK